MTHPTAPARLDTAEALAFHLQGLAGRDERLAKAIARAGEVVLRLSPSGFEGMARIVCGQQLSVASARAIWGRVEALGAITPAAYLSHDEATLRATAASSNAPASSPAGRVSQMNMPPCGRFQLTPAGMWRSSAPSIAAHCPA